MENLDRIDGLPLTGVVINTYQRPLSLQRTLRCLAKQAHTDFSEIHVVVVNDGSHGPGYDKLVYMPDPPFTLDYYPQERAENDTPRLYSLKNFGVRKVRGDLIWFLDDDLLFDDHTLFILRTQHMLLEHAHPVLVPHYADSREPHHYQNPFPFMPQPSDWDKLRVWVSFAGLSLWRRDFEAVDGVDVHFDGSMGFADLDLGIRLFEHGCQVCLADGITCFIDDSETGSHRDAIIHRQMATDPHRNGRLFIEKWGEEEAAKYGVRP